MVMLKCRLPIKALPNQPFCYWLEGRGGGGALGFQAFIILVSLGS